MPYYREKEHILQLPSQASLPTINVLQSNTSLLNEKYLLSPYINWIVLLINLNIKTPFLSHSDKNNEDNLLFNCSLEQNMDDNDDILDIDSWFDDDTEYSMILTLYSAL